MVSSAAAQAVEIAVAALEGSLPLPSVFSNDTGDMVYLFLKDVVAGLFWVFLLLLGLLLTLEGNRCSGDGAARCVLLTLRARGLLHGGHVLGLRVLFRWDITSMSQRGVRGSFEDALALAMMTPRLSAALHVVAEFVEVWQQAAAARECHIAFWAKATPRVDVDDTPNTTGTTSSTCGLWLGNLDNVGKEEGGKGKGSVHPARFSFVRSLVPRL